MYFCLDHETRKVVDQNGFSFTADQFHKIRERYDRQRKPLDMTLSCQRLIQFNYDWDKLEEFYENTAAPVVVGGVPGCFSTDVAAGGK